MDGFSRLLGIQGLFFGLGFWHKLLSSFFYFTSYLYFFLPFRFLFSHPSHYDSHSSLALFFFSLFSSFYTPHV